MVLIVLAAALHAVPGRAEDARACRGVRTLIRREFLDRAVRTPILRVLAQHQRSFRSSGLERAFCSELRGNILSKLAAEEQGAPLTPDDLVERAIRFESFRIRTYLSAGVAPKRYFGFFDEEGDTADYETELRRTVMHAVRIGNRYAERAGLKTRISEREVAVTFLAEGGALLLTNPEGGSPDRVHPVFGAGLDNFREGFRRYPGLIKDLDNFFGTRLRSLLLTVGDSSILLRRMTFRESILGTAVMYLFEKELTASLMRSQWGADLMNLAPARQFIATSLVYNSGILFSRDRVEQIELFATGAYLAEVNRKSRRPRLPLYPPDVSLQRLKDRRPIPRQLTSWSAVYHILQRYGAWAALEKFSGVFKKSDFVKRY